MSSTLSFVSQEPKVGDPPDRCWEGFKNPKLQQFPGSSDNFQWKKYLGGGTDGFVFEVHIDERPVAVKIVGFLFLFFYWRFHLVYFASTLTKLCTVLPQSTPKSYPRHQTLLGIQERVHKLRTP